MRAAGRKQTRGGNPAFVHPAAHRPGASCAGRLRCGASAPPRCYTFLPVTSRTSSMSPGCRDPRALDAAAKRGGRSCPAFRHSCPRVTLRARLRAPWTLAAMPTDSELVVARRRISMAKFIRGASRGGVVDPRPRSSEDITLVRAASRASSRS